MIHRIGIILLVLIYSCGQELKEQPLPQDLITPDKMTEIIIDINLVEAQLTEVQLLQSIIKDSVRSYYSILFGKHQISKMQLEENFDYYVTQATLIDSIYANALAKLTSMEQEMDTVMILDDVITHIPIEQMQDLLSDTSIKALLFNTSLSFPVKHDSVLRYFKTNRFLLDSLAVSYRQFGVSLNFYAGNEKKLEKVLNNMVSKENLQKCI